MLQKLRTIARLFKGKAVLQEDYEEKDVSAFRKLSSSKRDLTPWGYEQAVNMSHYLYQKNPIGRRFIDLPVHYCVGTDFDMKIKVFKINLKTGEREDTKRTDVQNLWDEFYTDPINRLDRDKQLFIASYYVNGELLIPVVVNPIGKVRIGYIDPSHVDEIKYKNENTRLPETIWVKGEYAFDKKSYKVINYDLDIKSPTYGKMVGEIFYFKANTLLGLRRGYPELIESADWLDGLDQFLWNNLEGSVYRNSFFLQEIREGISEEQLKNLPIEPIPPSGIKKITNEKVKYNMINPDLKAHDVTELLKMYRQMIVAGKGYPSHWFDAGESTNRATAYAQAEPAIVTLKAKQDQIKYIFKDIARFVIDQAIIAGRIKLIDNEDEKEVIDMQVSMAALDKKEIETLAGTFNQTIQALMVAVDNNWVSEDNAKRLVDNILTQMGVEVDTNETVEDIRLRKEEYEVENQDVKKIMEE